MNSEMAVCETSVCETSVCETSVCEEVVGPDSSSGLYTSKFQVSPAHSTGNTLSLRSGCSSKHTSWY